MVVDYSKGKIYQIISNDGEMCYIGSTTRDKLSQRLAEHCMVYKHNKMNLDKKNRHGTNAHQLFDKYGVDNCGIELIENFPCNNKDELRAREGYFIRNKKQQSCCVNARIEGRTPEEILEKNKEYKKNNKEKIKARKSKLELCDCGVIYTHDHKSRHIRSDYHKKYENGDFKDTDKCECGLYITTSKQRHIKSDKHKEHIKNKTTIIF